jgi:hypothetical protein
LFAVPAAHAPARSPVLAGTHDHADAQQGPALVLSILGIGKVPIMLIFSIFWVDAQRSLRALRMATLSLRHRRSGLEAYYKNRATQRRRQKRLVQRPSLKPQRC